MINTPLTWTVSQVRAMKPCGDQIETVVRFIGRVVTDDEPLPLTAAIDADLSLNDVCWALRRIDQRRLQLWAADCAEMAIRDAQSVLSLFEEARPDDNRPRQAIEAATACVTAIRNAAADAAAYAADTTVYAAYAAAYATADAAYAAAAAYAADTTADAAYAAYATADAAYAAAYAAYAAYAANAATYAAYATADAAYAAAAAREKRRVWCRARLREYIAGTISPMESP